MAPKKTVVQRTDKHPFLLSMEDVARQLETSMETGLSARKVQELQRQCLPNELECGGGPSGWKIFIKQMTNAMILVR
jgi:magnesium-transporting ATPase (P-type)